MDDREELMPEATVYVIEYLRLNKNCGKNWKVKEIFTAPKPARVAYRQYCAHHTCDHGWELKYRLCEYQISKIIRDSTVV